MHVVCVQETALNHVWMSGLLGDGMGATHGMIGNDLIWVVSRMQVQIESYPVWCVLYTILKLLFLFLFSFFFKFLVCFEQMMLQMRDFIFDTLM